MLFFMDYCEKQVDIKLERFWFLSHSFLIFFHIFMSISHNQL